jgi:hypothetical protein
MYSAAEAWPCACCSAGRTADPLQRPLKRANEGTAGETPRVSPLLLLLLLLLAQLSGVRTFAPGADAGWTHASGLWLFSEECLTPACDITLPFGPAPTAGHSVELYNRNIYREFQVAFKFRLGAIEGATGPTAGFVFGRATNGSASFLALEFCQIAGRATLSRYSRPGGGRTVLGEQPWGSTSQEPTWHTVRLNVSGTPGNRTAPAVVRVEVDNTSLTPWVDGTTRSSGKLLHLPELASYGFVGFTSFASSDGGPHHIMPPEFWLDPSNFLNASYDSPPSFAPLVLDTAAHRNDTGGTGSSHNSHSHSLAQTDDQAYEKLQQQQQQQQKQLVKAGRSPVKSMSIMTFWSGGGDPCIRTRDEYQCVSYPADLRDESDWVTMRGLRDNDPIGVNLNGSDYMYRKTGLSGMVTFDSLWDGALWPCTRCTLWWPAMRALVEQQQIS